MKRFVFFLNIQSILDKEINPWINRFYQQILSTKSSSTFPKCGISDDSFMFVFVFSHVYDLFMKRFINNDFMFAFLKYRLRRCLVLNWLDGVMDQQGCYLFLVQLLILQRKKKKIKKKNHEFVFIVSEKKVRSNVWGCFFMWFIKFLG